MVILPFLMQFLTLSVYAFFVGFCFCDGFNLHVARKLVWFCVFAAISIYILNTTNEFDLALILPVPTLLAILFCSYEKRRSSAKKKQPGADIKR